MKKLFVLAAVAALTVPAFAGNKHDGPKGHKSFEEHRQEMLQNNPELAAEMEAKKAEMEAQHKKMKETQEAMKKWVAEYKNAAEGSKEQSKAHQEIVKLLDEVRNDQIAFREQQIANFEKRLADMKTRLEEESTRQAKQQWADEMAERVIEKDGDLRDALAPMGKGGPTGPKHHGHFKGGPKGPKPGFFKGGHRHPPVDTLPMPPAPKEEK